MLTRGLGLRMNVALLIVVAFGLVAVLANHAVWLATTTLSTDRFVDTFAPLPEDPSVARALGEDVADAIVTKADVTDRITNLLPDGLSFIAVPITTAVGNVMADTATDIIGSDRFADLWSSALRVTHEATLLVLKGGERGNIEATDGTITLDLSNLAGRIDTALTERGIDVIDADKLDVQIVLYESDQVGVVETIARLIYRIRWLAPIALVLLAIAALVTGTNRRRVTLWMGVALAVAMLATLVELRWLRHVTVSSIVDPVQAAGADKAWSIVTDQLVTQTWALLVLGLVAVAAAWVTGPSTQAVSIRRGFAASTEGAAPTGAVAWAGSRARVVQWVAVAVGAALLLMAPAPSGLLVLVVAGLVGLVVVAAAWARRATRGAGDEPAD